MERELYEWIRYKLEEMFKNKFTNCHLEITSNGNFSEEIKSKVPDYHDIIFSFLKKKNSPDLTGFVKEQYTTEFITVEIKKDVITLEDVYQAKRYADLFRAKYGFLITTKSIPTEIKRLCQKINILYIAGTGATLKLGEFDTERKEIQENKWFPEPPFKS
jgi:hypothetical protein